MKWRPIKSARKGKRFLFIESCGRIQVGRIDSQWGEAPAVWVCLTGGSDDWYPSIDPTHWMPLPNPPQP